MRNILYITWKQKRQEDESSKWVVRQGENKDCIRGGKKYTHTHRHIHIYMYFIYI